MNLLYTFYGQAINLISLQYHILMCAMHKQLR